MYGGVLLLALGWSLALSPLALAATALLWLLLGLKSRHEELMLLERYPGYAAYRARVRRRFVPSLHAGGPAPG
jgi:protein-S-isoprenylcysteine O-methyltransferase Ste14